MMVYDGFNRKLHILVFSGSMRNSSDFEPTELLQVGSSQDGGSVFGDPILPKEIWREHLNN